MADVIKTYRNYICVDRACGICGEQWNTWEIEIVKKKSSTDQESSTYFYCFACDGRP